MSWLLSIVPYILIAGAITLGLFSLHKDWRNYGHPALRKAVAVVLVFVGALQFVRQYRDDGEKKKQAQKAAEDIQGLKAQVRAANDAQKENTRLFLASLNTLSQRVSDLQTQVTSDVLQKKLASVQAELQNTQKALAPSSKAKLVFSFVPFFNPAVGQGEPAVNTDVTLPVDQNGSVHVEFSVLNMTDVDAVDGELTLQICDQCKFAKEPSEFTKPPGEPETQRLMTFRRILALVAFHTLTADIIVPPSIQAFPVGIVYRCRSCVLIKEASQGIVHLVR